MFGETGGCKALARLPDGSSLIDHILLAAGEVDERIVLGSPHTCPRLKSHMTELGCPGSVVERPRQGTGRAICDLIDLSAGEVLLITAGDVVGPPGVLARFFRNAIARVQIATDPLCVVAAGCFDPSDDSPTFLTVGPGGSVRSIVKTPPSGRTFVGVRVMNRAFANAITGAWQEDRTDTGLLRTVLAEGAGFVEHIDCPGIFDVDTSADLERAGRI